MSQSNNRYKNAQNGAGFSRVVNATLCSIKGFKAAIKYEAAFRQELMLSLILLPIAVLISADLADLVLLVSVMLLVLMVELLNSAIESVVDRVGTEHHELSGRAKDLGSAAVSLALVVAGLVWLLQIVQFFTG